MLSIPPRTTPAAAPTPPSRQPDAAPAESPRLVPTDQPEHAPNLNDLFGAPPVQHAVHASPNGGGGGAGTTRARNADPLAGASLPGQKDVVVQRSLGDPAGYTNKLLAIAWARAIQSDRAMVVRDAKGLWHAVETNRAGQDAAGGKGAIDSAIRIGKVDPATYDRLKSEAMKGNDPAKWKTFAAYAIGVPESEIKVIGKGDTPSDKHININLSPDFNAEGRTAGFDPTQPPWIQLGPAAFNRPANAVATLAHEVVHARHREIALDLYKDYVKAPHGRQSFQQWVIAHAKGNDGYTKGEIVAGYYDGKNAATELAAHVEAARVAFASGDLEQAKTDLNKVATLPVLPQMTQASIDTLKALRDGLSGDARAVFREVAGKSKDLSVLHGLRDK